MADRPAWYATTARMATARSPSMSGRKSPRRPPRSGPGGVGGSLVTGSYAGNASATDGGTRRPSASGTPHRVARLVEEGGHHPEDHIARWRLGCVRVRVRRSLGLGELIKATQGDARFGVLHLPQQRERGGLFGAGMIEHGVPQGGELVGEIL